MSIRFAHSVLLLALLLGVDACAYRVPEASICEVSGQRRREAAAGQLTAMTFNLYNRPWSRSQRLVRALSLIEELGPDIVGLQEVSRWAGDDYEIIDCWSKRTGMSSFVYWLEEGVVRSTGLGLLSRYPIREAAGHDFAENRTLDHKGFIHAVIDTPDGPVGVVNVHLAPLVGGAVKEHQFERLSAFVGSLAQKMPVVLLGDFNEEHSTPLFDGFIHSLGATDLYSVARAPKGLGTWAEYGEGCDSKGSELLDYIFIVPTALAGQSSLEFAAGRIVNAGPQAASDHCPVFATLRSVEPQ